MIACRKSFTDTLLSLARMDKDIIAVTTDARGSVTLNDFAKRIATAIRGVWYCGAGCCGYFSWVGS